MRNLKKKKKKKFSRFQNIPLSALKTRSKLLYWLISLKYSQNFKEIFLQFFKKFTFSYLGVKTVSLEYSGSSLLDAIDNLGKMLQECPVEPLHHSIRLWMEHCSPGLVDLQFLAYLREQIQFEVPLVVCMQLQ